MSLAKALTTKADSRAPPIECVTSTPFVDIVVAMALPLFVVVVAVVDAIGGGADDVIVAFVTVAPPYEANQKIKNKKKEKNKKRKV